MGRDGLPEDSTPGPTAVVEGAQVAKAVHEVEVMSRRKSELESLRDWMWYNPDADRIDIWKQIKRLMSGGKK